MSDEGACLEAAKVRVAHCRVGGGAPGKPGLPRISLADISLTSGPHVPVLDMEIPDTPYVIEIVGDQGGAEG